MGVWTEMYLTDSVNHHRNGNTFMVLSIYLKKNLRPHLIKQMMKSILVKRWKNDFGNSFCNKYFLYWTKVHQHLFGKCILFSGRSTHDHTSPETPAAKPRPGLSPGFIPCEGSVARGSAALPQPHSPFSLLFFSSFVLLPPCVLTTLEKWPAEMKRSLCPVFEWNTGWNKYSSLLSPKALLKWKR